MLKNPILKKLLGETAVYGLSSVLGRMLFFLLTPLYTTVLSKQDYGQITELFAYSAFLMLFFTYRIEMSFFRFGTDEARRKDVFSTAIFSLFVTSISIATILILLVRPIADVLRYGQHPEYLVFVILILTADALCEIPFAKLRVEGRSLYFASIKLVNILSNISFNLFFLLLCPYLLAHLPHTHIFYRFVTVVYNPNFLIGYIFLSNLLAAVLTFLLLLPQYFTSQWKFDAQLWLQMMSYSLPLVVVGLAGNINEVLDRTLLKWWLPFSPAQNESLLGEYGAGYKLTMILTLFTQAFRMAAEPFFFKNAQKSDARKTYADVTKFFTVAALFGLLVTLLYLDILKNLLIAPKFWDGIAVVPVLLFANLFLGIYYNISSWYRLTDNTKIGAYISIFGAFITIICNFYWIPVYGYAGSAWATFICYGSMVLLCYLLGQRYYPVPYESFKIIAYILWAFAIYAVSAWIRPYFSQHWLMILAVNTALLLLFSVVIYGAEKKKAPNI